MTKKLLIVNNNFDTGGVQRSLANLLNLIHEEYDITLFVFSATGDYSKRIPDDVEVLEANPILNLLGISQKQAKTKGMALYLLRGALAFYTKLINCHLPIFLMVSTQKKLMDFDVAISFLHNDTGKLLYGGCNDFVIRRVESKKKVAFLHCDFSEYGGNTRHNRKSYRKFDKVAAVSEGCKKSFVKAVSDMEDRTHCVYNCHNYTEYKEMAKKDPVYYPGDILNIVTAARIDDGKGIIRTVKVLKEIKDEGYRFCWHVLGDGNKKIQVEELVRSLGLENEVILYGNQKNPYRYIKNADLFLLPSYHEAAPMVFGESKSLGVPVITTETTSARDMILEDREGTVCENSSKGIYRALKAVLNDPSKLNRWKLYLSNKSYDNNLALEQFRKLIE